MDGSTPGFPVHHQLPELTQSQVVMSVMTSSDLILCRPLLLLPSIFPSIRVFSNESVLCIRCPKIGVSASTSVLPMNIQYWFPLGWTGWISLQPVQFSSVAQSCPTLCDPMNCSTPGLPVHNQLPEFTQTHVHWVSDAIQPSQPLLSPSPPVPNPSKHQGLFQWVNSSHEVAKVLEFDSQKSSSTPQFKSSNSSTLSFPLSWKLN